MADIHIAGKILNRTLFLKNIRNGKYSFGLAKTHFKACSYLIRASDYKERSLCVSQKNENLTCNLSRKFNFAFSSSRPETLLADTQSEQSHSHEDHQRNNNKHSTGWLLLAFWGVTLSDKSMEEAKTQQKDPEQEDQIMADEMLEKNDIKGLYQLLVAYKNSENAELLWRLARASKKLAELSDTNAEDKKRLTYEGYDIAKNAVDRAPDNFACHKWYGIMLSEVGDYEGNKKKILNAYAIQEHFNKAIQLEPNDATSHHLLGAWCFTFAELPWYQRKLAATIFASPPTSTYEEALEHFEHAEKIDPGFYSTNQLMLAKSYIGINKKDTAKYWLQTLTKFPAQTDEDQRNKEEAAKLLEKI